MGERNIIVEMFAKMGDIVPFHRAIDHEVKGRFVPMALRARFLVALDPGGDIGHHQIVENAALLVEKKRIAHAARLERSDRAGEELFQLLGRALARDQQLAHVADIEQRGLLAGPVVFGDDALKLNRHLVAGEVHHPRALAAMPGIERQLGRGFFRKVVRGKVLGFAHQYSRLHA